MPSHTETLAALRATGRRITRQRQIVLEIIENGAEHLDAEAICRRALETDPNINMATVFRTLTVLNKEGLIEQRLLLPAHARKH